MNGKPKGPTDDDLRAVSNHFELFCDLDHKETKAQIAATLNMTPRLVEMCVYDLRQRGMAICTDAAGYWLAQSPDEMDATIGSFRRRLGHIHATLRALEHTREGMIAGRRTEPNGQIRLFTMQSAE